ncbi:hypothetical protein [Micromonospora sp. CPCC 206061]|uniref:hypothetical protein n=1 Tax=Micromonospora sp. CPCC 206061 TaxID=3122410 RepID=UPI002FEF39F2
MRARRLASIVVVACLGLGVLTGCQVDSGKAAIIGGTSYTEDQVTEIYENALLASSDEPTPSASPAAAAPAVSRQKIVDLLVSLELGRRIVEEKKFPAPEQATKPEEIASALGAPPQSEYVKLWAAWLDVQNTIVEHTPRAGLTDEGLMQVYQALVRSNAIQGGMNVTQVREAFGAAIFAEAATIVSTSLGAEVEKVDAEINPKYQPLGAPLAVNTQQGPVFYALPYVSSDMVTDVSL